MPFSLDKLRELRRTYGWCSSWAAWANPEEIGGPKRGMSDLAIFDLRSDNTLLETLHCNAILVGLNIANNERIGDLAKVTGDYEPAFMNFHSDYRRARDFQLRRALRGTKLWGSWMTDIINGYNQRTPSDQWRAG